MSTKSRKRKQFNRYWGEIAAEIREINKKKNWRNQEPNCYKQSIIKDGDKYLQQENGKWIEKEFRSVEFYAGKFNSESETSSFSDFGKHALREIAESRNIPEKFLGNQ